MLSFRRGGHPIARVKGGRDDGKIVSLHDELREVETQAPAQLLTARFFTGCKKNITQSQINTVIQALNDNAPHAVPEHLRPVFEAARSLLERKSTTDIVLTTGHMAPVVNTDKDQVDVIYVAGPPGAGKSIWCAEYIRAYRREYPTRDIFLFSQKPEDKAFEEFEDPEDPDRIKRIPITEEYWLDPEAEPIGFENFKKSLVIFDDIDTVSNKKLSSAVTHLRDQIIAAGRSGGSSVIATGHMLTDYTRTRHILACSNVVVFFPRVMAQASRYFLDKYKGFPKEIVQRILRCGSRWVCLFGKYPGACVTETEAFLTS
jgi:hypothetical protein